MTPSFTAAGPHDCAAGVLSGRPPPHPRDERPLPPPPPAAPPRACLCLARPSVLAQQTAVSDGPNRSPELQCYEYAVLYFVRISKPRAPML